MSAWKLAMVLALPLMWGGAKPRTWLAMFVGAVAAIYAPFASAYVFIDIASGAAVLKRPACIRCASPTPCPTGARPVPAPPLTSTCLKARPCRFRASR